MMRIARLSAFIPLAFFFVTACSGSPDDSSAPSGDPTSAPAPDQEPTADVPPGDPKAGDPPAPKDVKGRASYYYFDEAVANARIDLGAGPTFALTQADGSFSLAEAPAKYDLTVSVVSGAATITDRWVGLTTRTPVLESGAQTQSTAYKATISGTVPGIGATIPNGKRLYVFARTHFGGTASAVRYPGDTPDFTLNPQWHGDSSRNVTVHAQLVTISAGGGAPTAFDGAGSADVAVADGATVTDVSPALAAVSTTTLTGTFDPASFTGNLYAGVMYGDRRTEGYATFVGTSATSPFTILLPSAPGTTKYTGFVGSYPSAVGGQRLVDPAQSISFAVPPSPSAASPADATAFSAGMTFSWDGPDGVYRFELTPKTGAAAMYFVTTTEKSVTLPASFVPKAASTYNWRATYFTDAQSPDALVGPNGWSLAGGVTTSARTVSVP